jgi:hypothetical protein
VGEVVMEELYAHRPLKKPIPPNETIWQAVELRAYLRHASSMALSGDVVSIGFPNREAAKDFLKAIRNVCPRTFTLGA